LKEKKRKEKKGKEKEVNRDLVCLIVCVLVG